MVFIIAAIVVAILMVMLLYIRYEVYIKENWFVYVAFKCSAEVNGK